MAKKAAPYRSIKSKVYHTNPGCKEGNNIERGNRTSGKGGNRPCKRCKEGR